MCPAWPSPLVDDTGRPDIDAEKNRRPVVHVFAKFPDRALRLVSQICATFVKGQTKVVRWSHAARTKKSMNLGILSTIRPARIYFRSMNADSSLDVGQAPSMSLLSIKTRDQNSAQDHGGVNGAVERGSRA